MVYYWENNLRHKNDMFCSFFAMTWLGWRWMEVLRRKKSIQPTINPNKTIQEKKRKQNSKNSQNSEY